jgi:hypothetical protein
MTFRRKTRFRLLAAAALVLGSLVFAASPARR